MDFATIFLIVIYAGVLWFCWKLWGGITSANQKNKTRHEEFMKRYRAVMKNGTEQEKQTILMEAQAKRIQIDD